MSGLHLLGQLTKTVPVLWSNALLSKHYSGQFHTHFHKYFPALSVTLNQFLAENGEQKKAIAKERWRCKEKAKTIAQKENQPHQTRDFGPKKRNVRAVKSSN